MLHMGPSERVVSEWHDAFKLLSSLPCAAGDMVSFSLTLNNSGNVKLRSLQVKNADVLLGARSAPFTCTVDSDTWSTGGNLTVGQQLTCNSSFEVDQATVEIGELSPSVLITADNMAQQPVTLSTITFVNTPSLDVTVDPNSCATPRKAGMRTWLKLVM